MPTVSIDQNIKSSHVRRIDLDPFGHSIQPPHANRKPHPRDVKTTWAPQIHKVDISSKTDKLRWRSRSTYENIQRSLFDECNLLLPEFRIVGRSFGKSFAFGYIALHYHKWRLDSRGMLYVCTEASSAPREHLSRSFDNKCSWVRRLIFLMHV